MSNRNNKLKILYVIQKIHPEKAGAGINLHNFLPYCKDKFSYRVLALESNIKHTTDDESLSYFRYKTIVKNRQLLTITQTLNIFSFIKHILWCDIVHFKSTPKGIFIITLLGKIFGKKIIQEPTLVGHDDPNSFSNYKTGSLLNLSWKLSNTSVFISSDIKDNAGSFIGVPITRGVNLKKFHYIKNENLKETMNIEIDKLVITQVGKISDRKNQLTTIRIAKKIEDKLGIKLKVILVGPYLEDEYYNDIRKMVKTLNLDVMFTGHVDDVESYLSISDIYLFPSKDEGFGVSVIQALASGNQTFMSPVGCYKELLDLGFDGVVNGNEDEWVEKVCEHLSNIDIKSREKNRSLVESFDEEVVSKKTLSLYKSVINNNS
ncbi:glycosyltransferase family 4 protein [Grimontia sp. SpTr1]|uniref:glycosyltransferase family 4 protein n=1 Tax=Grimontia sp. SpTr1 TaxID=2995319 RepID=UPI00248C66F2|nr:glycosyltransferase family 4 protein [Grimontia sp. SpTr1]